MLCWRPQNRFEELDRLYLAGGGTHPGSGLPVIFEGARITARLIAEDLGCGTVETRAAIDFSGADQPARGVSAMTARIDDLPVGVVGGGLAGLSAAVTLVGRGHRVVLFEANAWLGGKAAVFEQRRLSLRHGPDDPDVAARARARVRRGGTRTAIASSNLHALDPQWRCFFDDGSVIDLVPTSTTWRAHRRVRARRPRRRGLSRATSTESERLHEISERFFFWKSVEGVRDTFDLKSNMTWSTL